MAAGIPLTDADRWDWLILLRQQSIAQLNAANGVVLTCSALKRKYRDVIRVAAYEDHRVLVHFIYLRADEATLLARVRARQGHYMKDSMVHSQFLSLEEPTESEMDKDVLCVDVSGTMQEVQSLALSLVNKVLADDSVVESSS
jgi:gluconokinase